MAILYTEGWDSYGDPVYMGYRWNYAWNAARVTGRFGGYAVNNYKIRPYLPTITTGYGFVAGYSLIASDLSGINLLSIFDNTDRQYFVIYVTTDGSIRGNDFGGVGDVEFAPAGSVPLNSWAYIEVIAHDLQRGFSYPLGDGVEVYVDNVLVGRNPNGWTYNNPLYDPAYMYLNGNSSQAVDDMYFLTTDPGYGSGLNLGRLGPQRIRTFLPDSDGTTNQWTSSTINPNYQNVNQVPPLFDSAYNYDSVVSDVDQYNITGSATGTIHSVGVTGLLRKDDVQPRTCKFGAIPSGGVGAFNSSAFALSGNYLGYQRIFEHNPDTSANWLSAQLNGAQIAVKNNS